MIHCVKAFEKTFEGETPKKAYLNACKWLARHIYGNAELSKHVVIAIGREQYPTFTVNVYTRVDECVARQDFCKNCKMLHTLFYSSHDLHCDECKANAFYKKLDGESAGKVKFVKEVLEEKENAEN